MNNYYTLVDLLQRQSVQPKRKVFISYHHADQEWVDGFRKQFGGVYDLFTDCSLDQAIDSDDLLYVDRTIREDYITGTSITIVLCGPATWRRKCVDWEIYSTLYKDHALLGIMLPHHTATYNNGAFVRLIPDRLHTNFQTGYAHLAEWPQSPQALTQAIDHAIYQGTTYKHLKNNSAQKMTRNR